MKRIFVCAALHLTAACTCYASIELALFPEKISDYPFKGAVRTVNTLLTCEDDDANGDFLSSISYFREDGYLDQRAIAGQELAKGFSFPLLPVDNKIQTFSDGKLIKIRSEGFINEEQTYVSEGDIKRHGANGLPTLVNWKEGTQPAPSSDSGTSLVGTAEWQDAHSVLIRVHSQQPFGERSTVSSFITVNDQTRMLSVIQEDPVTSELIVVASSEYEDEHLTLLNMGNRGQQRFTWKNNTLTQVDIYEGMGILAMSVKLANEQQDACGNRTSVDIVMESPVKEKLDELDDVVLQNSLENSPVRDHLTEKKKLLKNCKRLHLDTSYEYFTPCNAVAAGK
ncbi:hypothetical protein ACQUQU_01985 [Thalassolituus sp. LLYu03]|uniref:hypothetical protein n=1 Tax=Thalassolituus sp. LLYu03 TaxID=3421656 RepID=UPI003D2E5F90